MVFVLRQPDGVAPAANDREKRHETRLNLIHSHKHQTTNDTYNNTYAGPRASRAARRPSRAASKRRTSSVTSASLRRTSALAAASLANLARSGAYVQVRSERPVDCTLIAPDCTLNRSGRGCDLAHHFPIAHYIAHATTINGGVRCFVRRHASQLSRALR